MNYKRVYRIFFWIGCFSLLLLSFVPIFGTLENITIKSFSFQLRFDYIVHFCVYFIICLYYLIGEKNKILLFKNNSQKKFLLILFFLAFFTEVVQIWVPSRSFNIYDLLSNLAGLGCGVVIIRFTKI